MAAFSWKSSEYPETDAQDVSDGRHEVIEIRWMENKVELSYAEMTDLARKWLNSQRYQVVGPYPEEAI